MCTITIPGKPIYLKRARVSRNKFYDPQLQEKQVIKWYMKKEWRKSPSERPIQLSLIFYYPITKSWSKVKRMAIMNALIPPYHQQDPDLSNFIKMYEDCGEGILWKNDNQIVKYIGCVKYWSDEPRTVLYFEEIVPQIEFS